MQPYRNLKVWEKAHELALAVYADTREFPRDELYGLTSQIRRAAVSIPNNIAEGCGKGSDPLLRTALRHAMGSAMELDYLCLLARDLGYLNPDVYLVRLEAVTEVQKVLASLIKRLRTHPDQPSQHQPSFRQLTANS